MNVLVVGANSYIGENFAKFAAAKGFSVDIADSYQQWKDICFAKYSSVIFVAGIAHRRQKEPSLYFSVNRDLAVKVAQKAKSSGVRQFVYLSSMAVYGKKEGEISEHTLANPRHNDYYGMSKFQAENALKKLESPEFAVAIVRPPMVYGDACPGKFRALEKIAQYLPVIPNNKNKRSIIYIDNLSEFLCAVAASLTQGVFCPQDDEYANTAELIRLSRRKNGKKSVLISAGFLLRLCGAVFPPVKTAFGSLYYTKELSVKPTCEFNSERGGKA